MDVEAKNCMSLWIGDEYKKDVSRVFLGNIFPPLPGKHNRISCCTTHEKKSTFSK